MLTGILVMLLAACGSSSPVAPGATGNVSGSTTVADRRLKALTTLPPGESGLTTLAGQAAGTATNTPGDYGPNLDDQRELYWHFQYKDGALGGKPGTPQIPKAGVQIYQGKYGVPIVYGDSVYDLWYGVGYVTAQQRLFLMDAVRRMGEGTLAELAGCSSVAADVQARVLGYTDVEYQQFFNRLSPDAKNAINGYVAGVNAWLGVLKQQPDQLPAEYAVLTSTPQPFTVKDVLASGVLITRSVAAEGGKEFQNIHMLRLLQNQLGTDPGRAAFRDMVWQDDPKAVVTVPDQRFVNQPPADAATFNARADYGLSLPDTIWKGDGTGSAAVPSVCGSPTSVASAGSAPAPTNPLGSFSLNKLLSGLGAGPSPAHRTARQRVFRNLLTRLDDWRRGLHGGSFALALGRAKAQGGGGLLISEPQLGYSYPSELYEIEIHSGPYNARGATVPGLPVVGIGYTPDVAWALTTGYSKTIESFIETICSTRQQSAGICKADQYLHDGVWTDMHCRDETVNTRLSSQGLPVGPAVFGETVHVCRTVHGPIVARDDTTGLARALDYAMWMHEDDTIKGIMQWNRATNLAEFEAGVRKVTWNENVTVATRDGDIAYFHPGLYPIRAAGTDLRFPVPGTGAFDDQGVLSFAQMPHSINPAQGFLANWNTKPAHGWLDGEGISATSRPGGPGQRVTNLIDQVKNAHDLSFTDLQTIDRVTGTHDPRAQWFLPLLADLERRNAGTLSATEVAALQILAAWDRSDFNPAINVDNAQARDRPAETIFDAFVQALRARLFGFTRNLVIDPDTGETVYSRESGVGMHLFDMSAMDNLTLRILDPSSSGLALHYDWLQGRSRDQVLQQALDDALSNLAQTYGTADPPSPSDLQSFTRVHPRSQICSLTGVVGPGSSTLPGQSCVTMPFEDRGSWLQLVGFEAP